MKLLKLITNSLKKYKIILQLSFFTIVTIISISYYNLVKIKDGLYLIVDPKNSTEISYISIQQNIVKYYPFPEKYEGHLNKQKEVTFKNDTIKLDYSSSGALKHAQLITNSSHNNASPITLNLTKTKYSDPAFLEFLQKYTDYERELKHKNSGFYKEVLRRQNSDFLGELHTFSNLYKIKLMPLHTLSFKEVKLDKATEFAGIFISKYDHSIKTYSFRDYRPVGGYIGNIRSEATFHIVPVEKTENIKPETSYFEDILLSIYYQDDNVIFGTYPIGGGATKPFIFYINFDEKNQYYTLGYGYGDYQQIIDYYSVFRTISEDPKKGELISLDDLTLSSNEFHQRYGIRYEEYFDDTKIPYEFRMKLKSLTSAPDIFFNEKNQGKNSDYHYTHFRTQALSGIFTRVKRYVQSLDDIKIELLEKHPHGKWIKNYFIHNDDPNIDTGISFLQPLQENIWIEIELDARNDTKYFRYNGYNLQKILYVKLLEHYDFSVIPKIPEKAIPNIGKYTYMKAQDKDSPTYQVKEGTIDSFGNLLTPDTK